eukprot:gene15163-15305_t
MFFYLSKILWFVAAPSNFIGLLLLVGVIVLRGKWRRGATLIATVTYALCAIGPGGAWLLRPLEDRFAIPAETAAPDGIIVLGGALLDEVSNARGAVTLGESGTRMTQFVALSRRFPQSRLVFSGGSGNLLGVASNEAETARKLLTSLGVDPQRMVYEDKSRNTWENAVFSDELLRPKAGDHWILVTSAYHMPRAVGAFRKAGFDVTPWPAGYLTTGQQTDYWQLNVEASTGSRVFDIAVREWVGLVAYHLTGKTSEWFPR